MKAQTSRTKRFETQGKRKLRVYVLQDDKGAVFLAFPEEMKKIRKASKI